MRAVHCLAAAWLLCAGCMPASGAERNAGISQGQSWDAIKRLPDWSGSWQATTWLTQIKQYGRGPYEVDAPLNALGARQLAELKRLSDEGGDVPTRSYRCVPLGFPGSMDGPAAMLEILFTPGRVTITDATGFVRRIYTDGRRHDDQFITFHGDSIGHWERDGVLAVDTTGLDPGNEFILGLAQGRESHAIERIHLADPQTLVVDIAFDAPEKLNSTWKHQLVYKRSREPAYEVDCAQNNRSFDAQNNRQQFDLTLPGAAAHGDHPKE